MPHQIAYTDAVVTVDVFLKKKSGDGKRELKIAGHIKARLESIQARGQNQAYFRTVESMRRYLLSIMQSMREDQTDIAAIRANIKGKVGPGGHHLGIDIRVP